MAKPVPLHVLQRDEKELSEVKNSGKYLDCFSITLYTMLGIGTPLKWMTELWWELQMELSSSQQHFFQFAQSIFCFDWKSLQNYLRWVAKLLPNTMKLYGLAVLFPWQIFQGTQAGLLVVPCSHTNIRDLPHFEACHSDTTIICLNWYSAALAILRILASESLSNSFSHFERKFFIL